MESTSPTPQALDPNLLHLVVGGGAGQKLLPQLLKAAMKQGQTESAINIAQQDLGFTALDWSHHFRKAAKAGSFELMRYFAKRGADIQEWDRKDRSAFHFAAMGGNPLCCATLHASKATQLHPDKNFKTPLWYAAYHGHEQIVDGLLRTTKRPLDVFDPMPRGVFYQGLSDKILWTEMTFGITCAGCSIGRYTPVWAAVEGGNPTILARLISSGFRYTEPSAYGTTPLQLAVKIDSLPMVRTLLNAAPDRITQTKADPNSGTLLHDATENHSLDMVRLLLDAGASVHARGSCGNTALHIAYESNAGDEIIQALLEGGADPTLKNDWDQLPQELAPVEPVEKKRKGEESSDLSDGSDAKGSDTISPEGSTPTSNNRSDSSSPFDPDKTIIEDDGLRPEDIQVLIDDGLISPRATPIKRSVRGSPRKNSTSSPSPVQNQFVFTSPRASVSSYEPTQAVHKSPRRLFAQDENAHPNLTSQQ